MVLFQRNLIKYLGRKLTASYSSLNRPTEIELHQNKDIENNTEK